MDKVCVITGGGSGMGLATAAIMGKEMRAVIAGRSAAKLERAAATLAARGIEAEPVACDIADRASVEALATRASSLGEVAAVVNAAGMSPSMGEPEAIMAANALGTINVNEAFYEVMGEGSCIVDVASMAGYLVPRIVLPSRSYRCSRSDRSLFLERMMSRVGALPRRLRAEVSYGISKNFVIWYARTDAARCGAKGIRVLSVSPGSFETPMGEIERDSASAYTKYCAVKRFGRVEEIAQLLAFCASDKVGYLTGIDILCDGGLVASGFNPLLSR